MVIRCLSLHGQMAHGVWLWFGLFFPGADAVAFLLGGHCGDQVVLVGAQCPARKPFCWLARSTTFLTEWDASRCSNRSKSPLWGHMVTVGHYRPS